MMMIMITSEDVNPARFIICSYENQFKTQENYVKFLRVRNESLYIRCIAHGIKSI